MDLGEYNSVSQHDEYKSRDRRETELLATPLDIMKTIDESKTDERDQNQQLSHLMTLLNPECSLRYSYYKIVPLSFSCDELNNSKTNSLIKMKMAIFSQNCQARCSEFFSFPMNDGGNPPCAIFQTPHSEPYSNFYAVVIVQKILTAPSSILGSPFKKTWNSTSDADSNKTVMTNFAYAIIPLEVSNLPITEIAVPLYKLNPGSSLLPIRRHLNSMRSASHPSPQPPSSSHSRTRSSLNSSPSLNSLIANMGHEPEEILLKGSRLKVQANELSSTSTSTHCFNSLHLFDWSRGPSKFQIPDAPPTTFVPYYPLESGSSSPISPPIIHTCDTSSTFAHKLLLSLNNLEKIPKGGKTIVIKTELRKFSSSSPEERIKLSAPVDDAIFTDSTFSSHQYSSASYHDVSPSFNDEIKCKLPLDLDTDGSERYALVFSLYHLSFKKSSQSKRRKSENSDVGNTLELLSLGILPIFHPDNNLQLIESGIHRVKINFTMIDDVLHPLPSTPSYSKVQQPTLLTVSVSTSSSLCSETNLIADCFQFYKRCGAPRRSASPPESSAAAPESPPESSAAAPESPPESSAAAPELFLKALSNLPLAPVELLSEHLLKILRILFTAQLVGLDSTTASVNFSDPSSVNEVRTQALITTIKILIIVEAHFESQGVSKEDFTGLVTLLLVDLQEDVIVDTEGSSDNDDSDSDDSDDTGVHGAAKECNNSENSGPEGPEVDKALFKTLIRKTKVANDGFVRTSVTKLANRPVSESSATLNRIDEFSPSTPPTPSRPVKKDPPSILLKTPRQKSEPRPLTFLQKVEKNLGMVNFKDLNATDDVEEDTKIGKRHRRARSLNSGNSIDWAITSSVTSSDIDAQLRCHRRSSALETNVEEGSIQQSFFYSSLLEKLSDLTLEIEVPRSNPIPMHQQGHNKADSSSHPPNLFEVIIFQFAHLLSEDEADRSELQDSIRIAPILLGVSLKFLAARVLHSPPTFDRHVHLSPALLSSLSTIITTLATECISRADVSPPHRTCNEKLVEFISNLFEFLPIPQISHIIYAYARTLTAFSASPELLMTFAAKISQNSSYTRINQPFTSRSSVSEHMRILDTLKYEQDPSEKKARIAYFDLLLTKIQACHSAAAAAAAPPVGELSPPPSHFLAQILFEQIYLVSQTHHTATRTKAANILLTLLKNHSTISNPTHSVNMYLVPMFGSLSTTPAEQFYSRSLCASFAYVLQQANPDLLASIYRHYIKKRSIVNVILLLKNTLINTEYRRHGDETKHSDNAWLSHDISRVVAKQMSVLLREFGFLLFPDLKVDTARAVAKNHILNCSDAFLRMPVGVGIDFTISDVITTTHHILDVHLFALASNQSDHSIELFIKGGTEVLKLLGIRLFLRANERNDSLQHWCRVLLFHSGAKRSRVRVMAVDMLHLIMRTTFSAFGSLSKIRVPIVAVFFSVMNHFYPYDGDVNDDLSYLSGFMLTLDRFAEGTASKNQQFLASLKHLTAQMRLLYDFFVVTKFMRRKSFADPETAEETTIAVIEEVYMPNELPFLRFKATRILTDLLKSRGKHLEMALCHLKNYEILKYVVKGLSNFRWHPSPFKLWAHDGENDRTDITLTKNQLRIAMISESIAAATLFEHCGFAPKSIQMTVVAASLCANELDYDRMNVLYTNIPRISRSPNFLTVIAQNFSLDLSHGHHHSVFGKFFRVWFSGNCPANLRNSEFVYRTKNDVSYEDFSFIMHSQVFAILGGDVNGDVRVELTMDDWNKREVFKSPQRPINKEGLVTSLAGQNSLVFDGGEITKIKVTPLRAIDEQERERRGSSCFFRRKLRDEDGDGNIEEIFTREVVNDHAEISSFTYTQNSGNSNVRSSIHSKELRVTKLHVSTQFPSIQSRQPVSWREVTYISILDKSIDDLLSWNSLLYLAMVNCIERRSRENADLGIGNFSLRIVADSIHKSDIKVAVKRVVVDKTSTNETRFFVRCFSAFIEMLHALICKNRELLLLSVEEEEVRKRWQNQHQQSLHERENHGSDDFSLLENYEESSSTNIHHTKSDSMHKQLLSVVGVQAELQRALIPVAKLYLTLTNQHILDAYDPNDEFLKLCASLQGVYFSGGGYKSFKNADRFGVFPKAW